MVIVKQKKIISFKKIFGKWTMSLKIKVVKNIKNKLFNELINDMSKCQKCISLHSKNNIDCSLINIYKNKKF